MRAVAVAVRATAAAKADTTKAHTEGGHRPRWGRRHCYYFCFCCCSLLVAVLLVVVQCTTRGQLRGASTPPWSQRLLLLPQSRPVAAAISTATVTLSPRLRVSWPSLLFGKIAEEATNTAMTDKKKDTSSSAPSVRSFLHRTEQASKRQCVS